MGPESTVPQVRDRYNYQLDAFRVVGMYGQTETPQVLTADPAGNLLFDNSPGSANLRAGIPANITLQNVGTDPIAVAYFTVADFGTHTYHRIIAGGTADEDGKGGVLDIVGFTGKLYIDFAGTGTARLATTITYAK